MKAKRGALSLALAVAIRGVLAAAGGTCLFPPEARTAEALVAAEKNPPGDIPDTQVFVTYASPLGFSVRVPEGWARTDRPDGTRFADKYNTIDVSVARASGAPNTASMTGDEAAAVATGDEAAAVAREGRAVEIKSVKNVTLQSGPAVLIDYTSNSEFNPVTNRQSRLENNRYLIYRNGKLATIDLSAPLGADNADQWKLISNSFRWR
jgi:hypothetical protein